MPTSSHHASPGGPIEARPIGAPEPIEPVSPRASVIPDLSRRARAWIGVGAVALIAIVGLVDSHVPDIVFSPFYMVPVCLASWFIGRNAGIASALAAAFSGFLADLVAGQSDLAFAITNSALRLGLLTVFAFAFGRLRRALDAERLVAQREREAAAQIREASALRAELMRSVAQDAREPLGRIYAKVIDLGFDLASAATPESRAVIGEIAQASSRLTELVDSLMPEKSGGVDDGATSTPDDRAEGRARP